MNTNEAIQKIKRVKGLYAYESDYEALDMAISALEKQEAIKSCTPPSDDWEHYADRLHDIAYQNGYEQGKRDAIVPSPCALRPYRTFLEVEQPESSFIFRMRSGSRGPECALFEADGGAWKHVAMDTIKEYLQARLKEAGVDMPVIA